MAKKATKSSPPSTSPSDQDNKKFEEELAKAMEISKKELKKGNEEELQQLKQVLKASLQDKIKRTLERTSLPKYSPEFKEKMEVI